MTVGSTPQGNVPALNIPDSQDYPRLVYTAPYFEQVALAELIEPSVQEACEAILPGLVPPYVDGAANAAVQSLAVLLTGSTMTGPLFLNPVMPSSPSQAASMAYVDAMLANAGIPEVPPTPVGQLWGRETGQWVPIAQTGGVYLPLAGGVMSGQINMNGNGIINLAPNPQMPYGAAPAQWVLDQIASTSLYQGTWNADTNTPNLGLDTYWQNGFTWLVVTANVDGVVVSETIPGLTGETVYNGNMVTYSTVDGTFAIAGGSLTVTQANALYVQLSGSTMTGPLVLSANATTALGATPLQQVQSLIAANVFPEAPNDGQTYGRNGLQASWLPVLNLAGGIMTGNLTLPGNVTSALNAVPLQQVQSLITAGTAAYLPLTGGTLTGALSVNIGAASTVAAQISVGGQGISYTALGAPGANIAIGVSAAGAISVYQSGSAAGGGALVTTAGATLTGPLTLNANAASALQAVPLQQVQSLLGAYVPIVGGVTITGPITINSAAPTLTLGGPAGGGNLTAFGVIQANQGLNSLNGIDVSNGGASTIYCTTLSLTGGSGGGNLYTSGAVTIGADLGVTTTVSVGSFLQTNGANASANNVGVLAANGNLMSSWSSATDATLFLANPSATWLVGVAGSNGYWYVFSGGNTRLQIDLSGNFTWYGGTFQCSGPSGGGNVDILGNCSLGNALNISGNIQPTTNGSLDCGMISAAWSNVYSYNYPAPSSPTLKNEIAAPPVGALLAVIACPTVQFKWNESTGQDTTRTHRGFLTTDVETHVGADFVVKDPEGKGADSLLVNELIAVLWQAVQELAAQVKALTPATA